jgi:hypothetical protein
LYETAIFFGGMLSGGGLDPFGPGKYSGDHRTGIGAAVSNLRNSSCEVRAHPKPSKRKGDES